MNQATGSVTRTAAVPILRKITPKTICEAVGIDLMNLQRPVEGRVLYELYGHLHGSRIVPDKTGTKPDSIRFAGKFRAVTPDGEVFLSGVTFIPVLDDMIASSLAAAQQHDPKAFLELALQVAIVPARPGKPSMTGYEFDVQRLIPEEENADDPILKLQNRAKEARKLLAAPKSETVLSKESVTEVKSDEAPATAKARRHG